MPNYDHSGNEYTDKQDFVDKYLASHVNDLQDEVAYIEGLLTSGSQFHMLLADENGKIMWSSGSYFPVTPSGSPINDYQVANKKYVDDNSGGNSGGNIVGAYDIESGNYIDAGMSDEFNSETLDAQWTPIVATSGSVSLLEDVGSSAIYDLSTRPGSLLVQTGDNAMAQFRLDNMISNGEQLIVSFSMPATLTQANNEARVSIGVTDGDANYEDGNYMYMYLDGMDNNEIKIWNGGLVGNTPFSSVFTSRIYFRLIRKNDILYYFHSFDGTAWGVGHSFSVGTYNNIWVLCGSNAACSAPSPIYSINWVRHVSNTNLDPW